MGSSTRSRLGTGFHETFPLDRSRLSEVLRAAVAFDRSDPSMGGFSRKNLDDADTQLGSNMRRAFPRYGVGTGLFEASGGRYRLTRFGRSAFELDAVLGRPSTQWLLHYHLSAPEGPGPYFWHRLFAEVLRPADSFGRVDVERAIEAAQAERVGDKLLRSTATIFLGTYTNSAGLGGLRLILPTLNERGRYDVNVAPEPPPIWAFAYALADHWERVWPGQLTVGLDRLSAPGGLASLLFVGRARVDDYLGRLQREGWIEVFRVAPPFQLVRRWEDADEKRKEALDRIYADVSE